jgi:hypothetical protein
MHPTLWASFPFETVINKGSLRHKSIFWDRSPIGGYKPYDPEQQPFDEGDI